MSDVTLAEAIEQARLAADTIAGAIEEALREAKMAYAFGPNSFTYSCLHAALAAQQALGDKTMTAPASAATSEPAPNAELFLR